MPRVLRGVVGVCAFSYERGTPASFTLLLQFHQLRTSPNHRPLCRTDAALEVKHRHLLRERGGRAVCQRCVWGREMFSCTEDTATPEGLKNPRLQCFKARYMSRGVPVWCGWCQEVAVPASAPGMECPSALASCHVQDRSIIRARLVPGRGRESAGFVPGTLLMGQLPLMLCFHPQPRFRSDFHEFKILIKEGIWVHRREIRFKILLDQDQEQGFLFQEAAGPASAPPPEM